MPFQKLQSGSSNVSSAPSPMVFEGTSGIVNPKVKAQLESQSEGIKTKAFLNRQDLERLPAETGVKVNQAANAYRILKSIKDDINNDADVITAGVMNREFKAKLDNLQRTMVQMSSGTAASDRERAFIKSIAPVAFDVISSIMTGKDPKAVQINKLGQLAAETKGLGTFLGGKQRFDDLLKTQEDTFKEFTANQQEDPNQLLIDRMNKIQDRLNYLKGGQ